MKEVGNEQKYTTIPCSELALHVGVAGRIGKIVLVRENWAIVELDGKMYEGLISELVDIGDRQGIKK